MFKNASIKLIKNFTRRLFHIESRFDQNGIEIRTDKISKKYPYLWLRDNCKCPKCYNYMADEIEIDITKISDSIRPLKIDKSNSLISITWDDGHKSEYDLKNLAQNSLKNLNEKKNEKVLWNKNLISKIGIPIFRYQDYIENNSTLKSSLQSIDKYGAVIIEGLDSNPKEMLNVSKRIGNLQNSHFGADCVVTNSLSFKDRAYTNLSLKAHTDTVYLKNTAGIEMFHVIKKADTGGESLLVDGFYCGEILRQNFRDDFYLLSKLMVEFNFYKEGAYDFKYKSPVIELDQNENIKQIRFNPYHKVNLDQLTYDEIKKYYKAIRNFTRIIQSESNELWLSLNQNQVLLFDNFRLLHGRAAFTGNRTLVTIYLSRDDFLSKLNILES